MRVVLYNQMFGLNGKSFLTNIIGHWAVHYQADPKKIWMRVNISNTINTLLQSNADIFGIVEVLEGQEEEIKEKLKKKGYNYFYLGKGHKTKYSKLYVQELIASKIKGKQQNIGVWPMEDRLGGGGGIAHVCFSKQKYHLILAHLGLPSRKYYWKQISFLRDYLKEIEGKVIILGDFNLPYQKLKNYFLDYELVSEEMKTCSNTPIMRWFYYKDVDHIFVKGLNKIDIGSLDGYSDHKLIWADLS